MKFISKCLVGSFDWYLIISWIIYWMNTFNWFYHVLQDVYYQNVTMCERNIVCLKKIVFYLFGQNLRSNTLIRNWNIFVDSVTQFSAFRYPCNVICLPSQLSGTVEDSFTMLYYKQMSCLYFHAVKLQLCYALHIFSACFTYGASFTNRALSQYKDRLSQVWGFPC